MDPHSLRETRRSRHPCLRLTSDVASLRRYIEELLPDVLEGKIEPGRVFDRVTNIDGVPDGYRAMNERESIKVMIQF